MTHPQDTWLGDCSVPTAAYAVCLRTGGDVEDLKLSDGFVYRHDEKVPYSESLRMDEQDEEQIA